MFTEESLERGRKIRQSNALSLCLDMQAMVQDFDTIMPSTNVCTWIAL